MSSGQSSSLSFGRTALRFTQYISNDVRLRREGKILTNLWCCRVPCGNERLIRVEENKYDQQTDEHFDCVHKRASVPKPQRCAVFLQMVELTRTPHGHHMTTVKQIGRVVLVPTWPTHNCLSEPLRYVSACAHYKRP